MHYLYGCDEIILPTAPLESPSRGEIRGVVLMVLQGPSEDSNIDHTPFRATPVTPCPVLSRPVPSPFNALCVEDTDTTNTTHTPHLHAIKTWDHNPFNHNYTQTAVMTKLLKRPVG